MRRTTITEPLPSDADAIRRLMAEVIEHDVTQDNALLDDTLANVNGNVDLWLTEPARCIHLVARLEGRIVGVVLVKDGWNLCSLFVASDVQGQGVGRRLIEAAAVRCEDQGSDRALCLNAAPAAIPFYRKLGFVERPATRPLPPGFVAMHRPLQG